MHNKEQQNFTRWAGVREICGLKRRNLASVRGVWGGEAIFGGGKVFPNSFEFLQIFSASLKNENAP